MQTKKEAAATTATTPNRNKYSKINSYIIEILISICVFAIGYLSGIVGGLAL